MFETQPRDRIGENQSTRAEWKLPLEGPVNKRRQKKAMSKPTAMGKDMAVSDLAPTNLAPTGQPRTGPAASSFGMDIDLVELDTESSFD